jgi:chaperone modulatory protein CbpM
VATDSEKMFPQVSAIILEEQTELSWSRSVGLVPCGLSLLSNWWKRASLRRKAGEPHRWRFSGTHLRRATVALRLQRDLGVNLAGAALALELLDELDTLRARLGKIGSF